MLLVWAIINRDSLLYMGILAAIFLVITALFFRFSGLGRKAKIVSTCLACAIAPMYYAAYSVDHFPSFAVIFAVGDRFPDIGEWEIRRDDSGKDRRGSYTGTYIYYDLDKKRLKYDGITKDTVKDISVIAFFSHLKPRSIGVYYDKKSGQRYTDAVVTDIRVTLVDAQTKLSFAEQTITTNTPEKIENIGQAQSMVGYNSPDVQRFIREYFQK